MTESFSARIRKKEKDIISGRGNEAREKQNQSGKEPKGISGEGSRLPLSN